MELSEAKTFVERVSEASDVYFTIHRARHDGFPLRVEFPWCVPQIPGRQPGFGIICFIYIYMLAKFTSRWAFYLAAARLSGVENWRTVREVVNPTKDSKLIQVAQRIGVEEERFVRVSKWLRIVWPLFY